MDGVRQIPHTLEEALSVLNGGNVRPYGGGTDLMVGEGRKEEFLFLHRIEELRQIKDDGKFIRIGAECTFTEIEESPLTPPLLKEAVSQIAAPAIRNLGTIGGNVGNGSPKADSALALTALEAILMLKSVRGIRCIPIDEFYLGRKKMNLKDDELITEILIPKDHIGPYYYEKVGARNALAISRVSFAGVLVFREDKAIFCSTAFGAINDKIIHMKELDRLFIGKTRDEIRSEAKSWIALFEKMLNPQKGRISAEYRKTVCINLLQAFIQSVLGATSDGKRS